MSITRETASGLTAEQRAETLESLACLEINEDAEEAFIDIVLALLVPHLIGEPLALAWEEYCAALQERQRHCDGLVDLASLEPEFHSHEAYAEACQALVDDTLHVLIGDDR